MKTHKVTTEILDVAEARSRLPLVRPFVAEMVHLTEEVNDIKLRLATHELAKEKERQHALVKLDALHEAITAVVDEINALGAVVKSAADGLIDFYAWRDNEMVLLCWLLGEDELNHWHAMNAGFGGRCPIDGDEKLS